MFQSEIFLKNYDDDFCEKLILIKWDEGLKKVTIYDDREDDGKKDKKILLEIENIINLDRWKFIKMYLGLISESAIISCMENFSHDLEFLQ